VTVTNNIIARNVATIAGRQGAGIRILETSMQVLNNTIHDNNGDGVWIGAVPVNPGSHVANNLITSNTDSGIEMWSGAPSGGFFLHDNDVYFNHVNYVNHDPGFNDLSVDPQYLLSGPNIAAQLHLRATSPVSVTGSVQYAPFRDVDGDWRLSGGTVSMGADEIPGTELLTHLPVVMRQ
jgi:hypothetical protein